MVKALSTESNYSPVKWNDFRIHSIEEIGKKRLFTENLGPCIALCAKGYSEEGQLTHVGLSHQFTNKDLSIQFMEEMRKKVSGRIELFLAGGGNESGLHLASIRQKAAELKDVQIVDDVAQKCFKKFSLELDRMVYFGSSGIRQIYLDEHYNPRLHIGFEASGLNKSQLPESLDLKDITDLSGRVSGLFSS